MESLIEIIAFMVESLMVGFAFAAGAALLEKILHMAGSEVDDDVTPEPPVVAAPAPTPPAPTPDPTPEPAPDPSPPKPPKRRRAR